MNSEKVADTITLRVGRNPPFSLGFRSAEKILSRASLGIACLQPIISWN